MFTCKWCGCELMDVEIYCPECVEMLNDAMEHQLEVSPSDTEKED